MKRVRVGFARYGVICPACRVAFLGVADTGSSLHSWLIEHRYVGKRCAASVWNPRKPSALRISRKKFLANLRAIDQKPHGKYPTRYERALHRWRYEAKGPMGGDSGNIELWSHKINHMFKMVYEGAITDIIPLPATHQEWLAQGFTYREPE